MQQTVYSTTTTHGQAKVRLRRAALMLAVSAELALGAAACGGTQANPVAFATGNTDGGGGSGPMTVGPNGAGRGAGDSGQRSTGSYSLAFATCMRAHGVPDFPDPDGQAGQLGPSSRVDPNSPQFQSALNGPCESLAPPRLGGVGQGHALTSGAR
jgi:hypothetical protein